MTPTPEQDKAVETAFLEKEAADAAQALAIARLNQALTPYQHIAGAKPGEYALRSDTSLRLVVNDKGQVGIERPPVFGEAVKGGAV